MVNPDLCGNVVGAVIGNTWPFIEFWSNMRGGTLSSQFELISFEFGEMVSKQT